MSTSSLSVGVVGIHGFAKIHLRRFLDLRREGLVSALAAVAHQRDADPAWAAELAREGVALVDDLDALLARPGLGLVTVPVGIHLHVPMTEAVLARGLPVYLEKPVAGCLADVDRLRAHPRAGQVMVGFQHLYMPGVQALRARIAAGEFGRVRRAVVTSGWPRNRAYYQRTRWAGQLAMDGAVVRDSPANNACAHHLNLALFLCGSAPAAVQAALARANPIPSFDTCGLRVRLADGAEVVFNASHAGARDLGVRLRLECERAVITCADLDHDALWRVGATDSVEVGTDPNQWSYRHAVRHVLGGAEPVCSLDQARLHAQVIEAAHRSAISDLPGVIDQEGACRHPAMDQALDQAHAQGCTLAETGLVPGLALGEAAGC